jgi:hypothetical protein
VVASFTHCANFFAYSHSLYPLPGLSHREATLGLGDKVSNSIRKKLEAAPNGAKSRRIWGDLMPRWPLGYRIQGFDPGRCLAAIVGIWSIAMMWVLAVLTNKTNTEMVIRPEKEEVEEKEETEVRG